MKNLLVFYLILFALATQAQGPVSFIEKKGGTATYSLINTKDTTVKHQYDGGRLLPMASTQKLLTTAAAIQVLDSDFQYTTPFYFRPSNTNSKTLTSDIYIVGKGDPTIVQEDLDSIAGLFASQYSAWTGKLILVDNYFEAQREAGSWPLEDPGNYYGGGASTFMLDQNRYYITLSTLKPGIKAEVLKVKPDYVPVEVRSAALVGERGSGDQSFIYGWGNTKERVVRGSLPADKRTYTIKGYVPNPTELFGGAFLNALREKGVELSHSDYLISQTKPDIAQFDSFLLVSDPLQEIARETNFRSNNVYAESLFKNISAAAFGTGSFKKSIDTVSNWIVQSSEVDPSEFKLYDGSGLSPNSVISANAFARFLASLTTKPWFGQFLSTIPIAGKTGTAKYLDVRIPEEMIVYAKTGSIKGVRNLAGYILYKGQMYSYFTGIAHYYQDDPDKYELAEQLLQSLIDQLTQP